MTVPIKQFLDSLFNEKNNWQLQLLNAWPCIVGLIKTRVELLKVHEDTLLIGVVDSCWLQELYLLSPLLLQRINEKLDYPRIKKLRFKVIGIDHKKIKKNTQEIVKTLTKPIVLTQKEETILKSIHDDQLREALKEYLIRCHQQR